MNWNTHKFIKIISVLIFLFNFALFLYGVILVLRFSFILKHIWAFIGKKILRISIFLFGLRSFYYNLLLHINLLLSWSLFILFIILLFIYGWINNHFTHSFIVDWRNAFKSVINSCLFKLQGFLFFIICVYDRHFIHFFISFNISLKFCI